MNKLNKTTSTNSKKETNTYDNCENTDYDYDPYAYENYDDPYGEMNNNNTEVMQQEETHISLQKSKSYNIIKGDETIELIRDKLIKDSSDYLCLPRDEVILILSYCKWSIDRISSNDWYENLERNMANAGLTQTKASEATLKKMGVIPDNKDCSICYTPKADCGEFLSLKCKHFFCGECWLGHLEARLSDIITAPYTTCPQEGCNLIVEESLFYKIIGKLKDKKKTEILRQAYFKNFAETCADIRWCPYPGCGAFVRYTSRGNKEITCVCEHVFCFSCSLDGHKPNPCEMVKAWDKKNSSESENVKWITANTKACPKCHKYIEKNQGCDHMTCRQTAGGCGHEFCWVCFADWKTHKACNKFDTDEAKKKESDKNKIKLELEKYVFYFTRYSNHNQALKKSIIQKNKIEYDIFQFNQLKDIPNEELVFLREGAATLIKSRRLLKNSYILGFYFLDNDKKQKLEKSRFEYTQGMLERNADDLHGLLEGTTMTNILALETFHEFKDEFYKFKNRVTDLYSVTNEFMRKSVDEIENEMMVYINYEKVRQDGK